MANRTFNQFQGSLEKGVVQLFAEVLIAGNGAPTLVRGKGVASVTVGAGGVYTLKLQDTYQRTLGIASTIKLVGGAIPVPGVYVVLATDNVASDSLRNVVVNTVDFSDNVINPGECSILFSITLSNSTAL